MAGAAKKRPDFVARERENGYLYRPFFFPGKVRRFFSPLAFRGRLGGLVL
jgi:hypothetical protein